jgi:peroxiredoxin
MMRIELKIGNQAPDCVFEHLDGTPAHLSDFHAEALVLVFLRHLA